MVYRRGWVKVLYPFELEKILKEGGVENPQKVINILYGADKDNQNLYDYQVVDNSFTPYKPVKFWQRLNQIWIIPLLTLTIPFQWLFLGRVGFKNESKLGKLISNLTGLQ